MPSAPAPPAPTAPPPSPAPRKLALASAGAALVAAIVLVVAILPAEYGIDPTGLGAATGFKRLSDPAKANQTLPEGVEAVADDGGTRTLHALEAHWSLVEIPVATQGGFTPGPHGETLVRLPLHITNLTSLSARLSWNDTDRIDGQTTKPDTFEISIRAPQGKRSQLAQSRSAEGGEGSAIATLAWRQTPTLERTEKGLVLPLHEADNTSHGEWTFVVRLYSAGGLDAPEAPRDPGNSWNLTITAQTYELHLEEREGFAGDRVVLTLAPNRGVEYKFHMQPNATLRYAWTSTAPVYWDLHAEEDGKDAEDFARFQEGTSQGDAGSLTATFAGRHGWYFLNRGTESATITLETQGDYAILGVA